MRSACSLGFILLLLAVEIARAVDPISVDEIRAGMTGHGLTVEGDDSGTIRG
jgi:hypothetical protein